MLLEGQGNFCYVLSLVGDPEEMCVNFGFDTVGGPPDPDPAVASVAFETFEATFLEQMSADYTLLRVDMQVMTGAGMVEQSSTNAPSGGAAGGDPVPQNTSVLIHKNTADAGRGKSGRCYIPGLPEGFIESNGMLDSSEHAEWVTQAATFFEAYDGDDLPFLVVNHGATWTGGGGIITSLTVDPVVATQRRRLRR